MKFDVKQKDGATVLTIKERKISADVSGELKAEFLVLCKPKISKKLIVNLKEVEFCDSSGLSALLIAHRAMREHGGSVHLVQVHKKIFDLIKLSQLDRIFNINSTVAEALKN
ncbi:MAG: STAS domain-containing protein [Bacteroidota bacterium]